MQRFRRGDWIAYLSFTFLSFAFFALSVFFLSLNLLFTFLILLFLASFFFAFLSLLLSLSTLSFSLSTFLATFFTSFLSPDAVLFLLLTGFFLGLLDFTGTLLFFLSSSFDLSVLMASPLTAGALLRAMALARDFKVRCEGSFFGVAAGAGF